MQFENIHAGGCRDHRKIYGKKLARYACAKCKMDWDDHLRNKAVRAGRWKAEKPIERPVSVAFRGLASWYSAFVSMSTGLAAFFKAQQDPNKLQAFCTQHQCRPWAENVEKKSEAEILKRRTDIPPLKVPEWAVALTAGIDTQQRGFWFIIRAWGSDLTSHLVHYGFLQTFDEIEHLIFNTRYPMVGEGDFSYGIWRAAIDTGGGHGTDDEISRTQEVYEFLTRMRFRYGAGCILHGVKGASRRQFQNVSPPKSIESRGKTAGRLRKFVNVLDIRMIDTFALKILLHERVKRRRNPVDSTGHSLPSQDQRFYLHSETGANYARQFLSEELRQNRRGQKYWKQTGRDNHLLDAEVYAAACADSSWDPSIMLLAQAQEVQTITKQAVNKKSKSKTQNFSRW